MKKFLSRNIANGNPKATWKMIAAHTDPKMPIAPNNLAMGINAICSGTTSRAMTRRNNGSAP